MTNEELTNEAQRYLLETQGASVAALCGSDQKHRLDRRMQRRERRRILADLQDKADRHLRQHILKGMDPAPRFPWIALIPWWSILGTLVDLIVRWLASGQAYRDGTPLSAAPAANPWGEE